MHIVDAASDFPEDLVAALTALGCTLDLGVADDQLDDRLRQAAAVVVNPAIQPTHPSLQRLQAAGVPLTSELAMTWSRYPSETVVAVTGSNGKSTLAATLAASWPAALGGNFERSLLDLDGSLLDECETAPGDADAPRPAVLEVSSFQAAHLAQFGSPLTCRVAVLTSLDNNHLDWHGDRPAYEAAKRSLLERASEAIVGPPEALSRLNLLDDRRARPTPPERLAETVLALVADHRDVQPVQLPHRFVSVLEAHGVRCVDDSAATSPAAVAHALDRLTKTSDGDATVVLILGGRNKGFDLDALARHVAPRVEAVATIGETAGELARLIAIHGGRVRSHRSLAKAVRWGWKLLGKDRGGTLLLAPGLASTDDFADYRARGRAFADACRDEVAREAKRAGRDQQAGSDSL